ncbi:MAG: hypothetical protein V1647_05850 [Pseudomonadota bacterium]
MKINKKDRSLIAQKAKEYDVSRIFLFGSSIDPGKKKANDIDLAAEGLNPKMFFKFYGDLIFALSKPVDLVDLTAKNSFNEYIKRYGFLFYEKK